MVIGIFNRHEKEPISGKKSVSGTKNLITLKQYVIS